MQIKPIKRFELVELTISANQPGRFNFVTQPQLRNQPDQMIIIDNIEVYQDTIYSFSQLTSTTPGVPLAELIKAVLVLYVDGEESIKMIPLPQLIHTQNTNQPSVFQQEIATFASLNNVVWEKSYVQFSVAAAGSPYVIPFGVNYLRMRRDPTFIPSDTERERWIEA